MSGLARLALIVLLMLRNLNGYVRNLPSTPTLIRHVGLLRGVPQEILIYGGSEPPAAAEALIKLRPSVKLISNSAQAIPVRLEKGGMLWSLHKDSMQLDCTDIEDMYLGRHKVDDEKTAIRWNEIMTTRRKLFASSPEIGPGDVASIPLGDGGKLQIELDTAIRAVQRASFMSRSLQHSLILNKTDKSGDKGGSLSKQDKSPVTIADFAVQALIIDAIAKAFPKDKIIAEEDSRLLHDDKETTDLIVKALNQASGTNDSHCQVWDTQRLFTTIDLGNYCGTTERGRIWVLDPVDGTKGFMRGSITVLRWHSLWTGFRRLVSLGAPTYNC